jgi:hypothetical protein
LTERLVELIVAFLEEEAETELGGLGEPLLEETRRMTTDRLGGGYDAQLRRLFDGRSTVQDAIDGR